MVRVIFSRRHHPGSVGLRLFMWSPWSHCGIVDGDNVIQATTSHGVCVTPITEFTLLASEWAIVEFEADEASVIKAALTQVGKPYDWEGCAGIFFHHEWGQDDAWFCSELVAWALGQGGLKLFREDARRITPQHLWMLERPILLAA